MDWQELRIEADGEPLACLYAPPVQSLPVARASSPRRLCIVPYLDGLAPRDGKAEGYIRRLAELMTAAGAGVLFFTGRYAELPDLLGALRSDRDAFDEANRRTYGVIDACLRQGLAGPGGVILLGISRFGFQALHALGRPRAAGRPAAIDAVIASSPVVHWPALREFADLEGAAVLARHALAPLAPSLPPTPVLIQIGESDDRVSTPRVLELAETCRAAYAAAGAADRFGLQVLPVPGHQTTRAFWTGVLDWLHEQRLLPAE